MPQNSSQNSFNNITYFQHCQNSWTINIVQLHHVKKLNNSKFPKPSLQHEFQQKHTTTKWQCLNTKLAIKHEINNFPPPPPKKTHLEVHLRVRSIGLGVLKDPLFIIPFKWWMIFFPMKSKERRPIYSAKKREVWKMGFTKWVCSKNGQEHKDLKRCWGKCVKGGREV